MAMVGETLTEMKPHPLAISAHFLPAVPNESLERGSLFL
jgi:hypothetical protein